MDPIATYNESRGRIKREFALHPGRMVLRHFDKIGTNAELTFDLSHFDTERDRAFVKDPIFEFKLQAALLILIAFMLGSVWVAVNTAILWIPAIPMICIVAALLVLTFHNRRKEVSRFKSLDSPQAFEINSCGSKPEVYDQFIKAVSEQIKRSKP